MKEALFYYPTRTYQKYVYPFCRKDLQAGIWWSSQKLHLAFWFLRDTAVSFRTTTYFNSAKQFLSSNFIATRWRCIPKAMAPRPSSSSHRLYRRGWSADHTWIHILHMLIPLGGCICYSMQEQPDRQGAYPNTDWLLLRQTRIHEYHASGHFYLLSSSAAPLSRTSCGIKGKVQFFKQGSPFKAVF